MRPQTIQIFLPFADPQGIRVAEITTRTVQVFDVPRSEIAAFFDMPESGQVAVYYLFGDEIEEAPRHSEWVSRQGYLGFVLRTPFRSHGRHHRLPP